MPGNGCRRRTTRSSGEYDSEGCEGGADEAPSAKADGCSSAGKIPAKLGGAVHWGPAVTAQLPKRDFSSGAFPPAIL